MVDSTLSGQQLTLCGKWLILGHCLWCLTSCFCLSSLPTGVEQMEMGFVFWQLTWLEMVSFCDAYGRCFCTRALVWETVAVSVAACSPKKTDLLPALWSLYVIYEGCGFTVYRKTA